MTIVSSKSVLQFLIRMNLHSGKRYTSAELVKISEDWIQACRDWKVTPERFKEASNYLVSTSNFLPTLPNFLKALDETWSQNQSHPKAIEDKHCDGMFPKAQIELNKKGVDLLTQVAEGKISLDEALSHFPVSFSDQKKDYDLGSHESSNHVFGGKPYVPSSRTPEDILGGEEDLFRRHFELWQRCDGQAGKIHRSFSEQELSRISEINTQLLENGYRVDGISASDQLKWSLVSELHASP